MVAFILTETALQMALMERLVKSHPVLRDQDIRMRTDRGNIAERARSHFVHSTKPVVLVSSPQTVNPRWVANFVEVREEFIRAAVPMAKFLVLMVPPEVESLLFHDEDVVKAVLPGPVTTEDRVRGRYEALKVLAELFTRAGKAPFPEALIQRLAHADLSRLWRLELLRPLERFLLEVCLGQQQPDSSPSAP
ncbi:hypothetical protein [Pyxidicoccus trucidator]|uniref:hypothetical protein n=1 Tax=Pyxidicoccus trucidator TaxID=2709662 RepID=UPI001967FA47|nr:hypothetical protein [Pyxidicoccus trucidator]